MSEKLREETRKLIELVRKATQSGLTAGNVSTIENIVDTENAFRQANRLDNMLDGYELKSTAKDDCNAYCSCGSKGYHND